ncbi:uncharacterized protein LOC108909359 [Anoplophora glabripennis]|uniref:uncharacterized protein LOC108909359 n=1 Tax=Anoplophora glabripennis TaxID=217634 RepID=UPI000C75CBBE|nr:uncharacterized protein LOC108909359 [Anoplophora glabripennis]
MVVIIFLIELMSSIRRRYIYLDSKVANVLSIYNSVIDERICDKEVKEIKVIYGILNEIMDKVNVKFGRYIFFILGTLLLNMLNTFNWFFFYVKTNNLEIHPRQEFADSFLDPLINCICLAGIVMSCDRVERCGQDIVRTCYKLQGQVDKGPLRDELVLLTRYVEGLAPKISAWGFFQVNQRLLCGLFATFATYLIIILQFRKV